jgi:hypothetical protein
MFKSWKKVLTLGAVLLVVAVASYLGFERTRGTTLGNILMFVAFGFGVAGAICIGFGIIGHDKEMGVNTPS